MDATIASFIKTRICFRKDAVVLRSDITTAFVAFNGFSTVGRNKLLKKLRELDAVQQKGTRIIGVCIKPAIKVEPKEILTEDPMELLIRSISHMGFDDIKMESAETLEEEDLEDAAVIRNRYRAMMRAKQDQLKIEMRALQAEYKNRMKRAKN